MLLSNAMPITPVIPLPTSVIYHFACSRQDSIPSSRRQSPHFSGCEVGLYESNFSQKFGVLTFQTRNHLQTNDREQH